MAHTITVRIDGAEQVITLPDEAEVTVQVDQGRMTHNEASIICLTRQPNRTEWRSWDYAGDSIVIGAAL